MKVNMYNLKQLFRMNKVVYLLFILTFSLLFSLLSIQLNTMTGSIKSLSESSFKQSGYSNYSYDDNTYYIDVIPIVGYANNDIISTKYYIQNGVSNYYGNFMNKYEGKAIDNSLLLEDECAISKETSKTYKINVGDSIKIHSGFEDYNYKIKYIFDDYYKLSNDDYCSLELLIILGYNEELVNGLLNKSNYLFSDIYTFFSTSGEVFDKDAGLYNIKINILLSIIITLSITSVIVLLIEFIFSKNLNSDLSVYKKDGFSNKQLITYIVIDSFMKYILGMIYSLIISSIVLIVIKKMSIYLVISIIIAYIIMFVVSLVFQLIKNRKIIKN